MSDPRMRRASGALLCSLLLLPGFAGCGSHVPTTAPAARPAGLQSRTTVTASGFQYETGTLLWRPAAGVDPAELETAYQLRRVASVGDAYQCITTSGVDPATVAGQMALDGRALWAEPNYVAETAESRGHSFAFDDGSPDLSGYEDQSAAARVGLDAAHQVSRGEGVLVAVLDTGVDTTHPFLVSHLVPGYDFVDGDSDPVEVPDGIDSDGDGAVDEALGHGSHVTGIIALVAPAAKIMPLRVLDNDGRGLSSDIARAIDYARAHGARVLNLSLGMLVEDQLVGEAIFRARSAGLVVVTSAGNWGAESPEEFPAEDEEAIAVAASNASNLPATFTSFGSHIALTAPGESIRSTFWNGHTAVWSGTSMSAPWVAGGVALLLTVHPEWTPAQLLGRLAQTAIPIEPSVPESERNYGAGVIDLGTALATTPGDAESPAPGIRRPTLLP